MKVETAPSIERRLDSRLQADAPTGGARPPWDEPTDSRRAVAHLAVAVRPSSTPPRRRHAAGVLVPALTAANDSLPDQVGMLPLRSRAVAQLAWPLKAQHCARRSCDAASVTENPCFTPATSEPADRVGRPLVSVLSPSWPLPLKPSSTSRWSEFTPQVEPTRAQRGESQATSDQRGTSRCVVVPSRRRKVNPSQQYARVRRHDMWPRDTRRTPPTCGHEPSVVVHSPSWPFAFRPKQ